MTVKTKVLENGLTLICDTIRKSKLATIAIGVKTGSLNEKEEKDFGISHILEHMMFQGTSTRTSDEINAAIENTGSKTNAFTDVDKTVYYIKTKMSDLESMTEILFDMFLNSTFDEKRLEREKKVIIQELKMYKDNSASRVYDLAVKLTHLGTTLEHPIIGNLESIMNITSQDLKDYKDKHYTTDRTYISVSGNITLEELETLVNKYYICNNTKYQGYDEVIKTTYGNQEEISKDISQANTIITLVEIDRNSKEVFTMSLFNEIFCNGMSSKLVKRIRQELGLVYDISMFFDSYGNRGTLGISFASDYQNIDLIKENISLLLEEMKEGNFSEVEFLKAKNSQEYALMQKELNLVGTAIDHLTNMISLNHPSQSKKYLQKIKSIKKEDIIKFAKKISLKKANIAIVKPNEA